MYSTRRKLYSQNFLRSRKLVISLVGSSSITKNDLVVEIGPGKGIITRQLLKQAGQVIAVELDVEWYEYLRKNFLDKKLKLIQQDFLKFNVPKLPYKVFANVPFAIEGKIIRKLLLDSNPPQDCYVVVMRELAERLSCPRRSPLFSAMHNPWFVFEIWYRFDRFDFEPVPKVHAALFRFSQNVSPLLPLSYKIEYQKFVTAGFTNGQQVRNNLKQLFSVTEVDSALQWLSINKKIKPSEMKLNQWISLYLLLVEKKGAAATLH